MNREEVEKRTILLGIVGSQAYRINTATSDIDLKGIAVAKKRHYLGFETFEQKDQNMTTTSLGKKIATSREQSRKDKWVMMSNTPRT